ncbi:MAG: uroporphyrinogen decarboxylase family protein [Fimbriimonadales bacterium]
MTPRERIEAVLNGVAPDRLPFSFWYHFRTEPWFPAQLYPEYRAPASESVLQSYVMGMTTAEYEFWRRYQPDLLKVMHDIPYEVSDALPTIRQPSDWAQLPRLEPEAGHFGAQLEVLRRLRQAVPDEVPIIETVFNAFYYANKLSEGRFLGHLSENPEAVHQGLAILQANLVDYAQAVCEVCDGVYYAVNGISIDTAPLSLYQTHFLRYDRAFLEAVAGRGLVVLHLHGYGELYADLLADAPASLVCWSDRSCTLSLPEGSRLFRRAVMGGLNENELPHFCRERVHQQVTEAIDQMHGTPFVVAPGCSVPTDINPEVLFAIRDAVNQGR